MNPNQNGQWALVTGASSGIGEAFAKRFAKEGWRVVLVARSIDKLNALAHDFAKSYGVKTLVIGTDLRLQTACRDIYEKTRAAGIQVDCLVNNAGFGTVGEFSQIDCARELEMVDVNVRAVLELTHLFLPRMIERKKGWIVNVSSTAGFQPIPYLATYSATKAFVTILSEALWVECKDKGVQVLNFCPGRTKTNFAAAAGQKINHKDIRPTQTSEEVVDLAFEAMLKNKPTLVTNPYDNALLFLERFISRRFVVWVAGRLAKRMGYQ